MGVLSSLVLVILAAGVTRSQLFSHPAFNLIGGPAFPSGTGPNLIDFAEPVRGSLAHHAVVENAVQEAQLPNHLLNPFYKNPLIAAGLAKASLITNKEFAVFNREAEKIPRSEILKILQHAGFIDSHRRK